MKTILVPTDFSTYGTNAIEVAASLAQKTHARIILQHNVPTLVEYAGLPAEKHKDYPDIFHKTIAGDNRLNKLRSDYELRHLNVSKVVTQGITYEQIIEEAEKEDADLIVIGSHGNEQFDRFFIGSNIQKVMREATRPVMTVNHEFTSTSWKTLVFPMSLDEDISWTFESIKPFFLALDSTVHLLYVNTPENFKNEKKIHEQMLAFSKLYPDLKFETSVYNSDSVEAGILEYSKDIKADWLAMITHNRQHKDKYLIGIAEIIAFRLDIPLLTIRQR